MNKKRQRADIGGDNGFEEWGGYMAAKKNKLREQFNEQAQKQGDSTSDIFKNVAVFVNGYTVPSADEIKCIMMQHGGVYHHYFSTKHTTHIIATNLPDVKIKQLKGFHVNIVKPEWIPACLEAGQQIDFRPFLLYSCQSRAQPTIRSFAEVVQKESNCSNNNSGNFQTHQEAFTDAQNSENNLDAGESSEDLFSSPEVEVEQMKPEQLLITESTVETKTETSKVSARCATDPNFLSEFYANSRLHHISTMGSTFKQLVYDLRQKKNHIFSGIARLREWKNQNTHVNPSPKNNLCEDDDHFTSSLEDTPKCAQQNCDDKVIMHIDMDCFFVSVGLCKHPHLKGRPIAVTHSKGNGSVKHAGSDRKYEFNVYKERLETKLKSKNGPGNDVDLKGRLKWTEGIGETDSLAEIASCSYEARRKGVKNGMFVGAALKLCPDLQFIPYDFEAYQNAATILYNTVASYTLDIEAVSCDEMFVNCSDILRKTQSSVHEFATFIRKEIKEKTNCSASTGFGSNRLLARLATRKAKPDGIFHLEEPMVHDFMKNVVVSDLPGVGHALTSQLRGMGIFTCGELQEISKTGLGDILKGSGVLLYSLCRGIDNRPLVYDHQRKSVSAEVNYGIRFKTLQETEFFIRQLAIEVQTRLAEAQVKGSCITLKLLVRAKDAPSETAKFMGHGVCDSLSRSSSLPRAVGDAETIATEVLQIFQKLNIISSDLRGIGIQITKLESSRNKPEGAIDKFFIKNHNSVSDSGRKLSSKSSVEVKSSNAHQATEKIGQKKEKVFSNKGPIGVDHFMVARKKKTRKDNVMKLPPAADLDLDVLKALPADILREVMGAYESNAKIVTDSQLGTPQKIPDDESDQGQMAKPSQTKLRQVDRDNNFEISFSQIDPAFLKALPAEMQRELEVELRQNKVKQKVDSVNLQQDPLPSNKKLYCCRDKSILNDFIQKSSDVKEMIKQWVSQEVEPQPCDIHILEHYFCDLVHERCIDELYTILQFFRRIVAANLNCAWRVKFCNILSTVQESMQQVYLSSLQVEDF